MKGKGPKRRSRRERDTFRIAVLVAAVAAAAMLASPYYMPVYNEYNANPYYCVTASDCVPEQCCHPTSCINRNNAPDCTWVACTEECRPGTMDCGQGQCVCTDNRCTAVMG